MALKPCRECGKPISTEATTCPHCGVASPTATGKPVVIEATSKRFKTFQAAGGAAIVFSVILMVAGSLTAGAIIGGLGIVLYVYGRAGGWWHHG